jgi:hypothetical protein
VARPFDDLKNREFGFLTVRVCLGPSGDTLLWTCECACGRLRHLRSIQLHSGSHLSCGKCKINRGRKSAVRQRNYQIVAAFANEGASIEDIAERHGLTVEEVRQIVYPPKKRMPSKERQP